jgi:hypothetical protein
MTDPTLAQLRGLNYQMYSRAVALINDLRSVGVPAVIQPLGGLRTPSDQLKLYNSGTGVTSTTKSRHVTGMAFDLDVYGINRNSIPKSFWDIVGPYAEARYGLTWGGRWRQPYDPGHFQL